MQTELKHIYKEASEKFGRSEQFYKDLGNYVFSETYSLQKNPPSLIIRLKGIGRWFLRKARMEITVSEFDNQPDRKTSSGLDMSKIVPLFKDRLKDYELFLEKKNRVREQRKLLKVYKNQNTTDEKYKSD